MRPNLKAARELAGFDQGKFAELVGVRRSTVSEWETADKTIRPCYIEPIRAILGNDDPHLFDIVQVPCHVAPMSDTVNSSDLSSLVIPGSVRGWKELMELLRRQFIEALAKFGGMASFGNLSLALVSAPTVEPEEYLSQCTVAIDDCWSWLGQGNFAKVERALGTHMPTLRRFTSTLSPFQGIAASLAMEAKLMQAYLSSHKLDYTAREIHCAEAVRFAVLSGNRRMYTIALEWQGYTYTIGDSLQPQRAIAIFEQAFSGLESNVPLSRANISIGLALAHAQDKNETDDAQVRKYVELARMTLPAHPELDPFYRHCGLGQSELDQQEGQTYLYLAERSHNRDYAQMAYDAFEQSISKQAMNQSKLGQSLIRKANAARVLGDMDECVTCLTNGLVLAIQIDSLRRFNEVQDVIGRIPSSWQKETAVKELQKDISHALMVARR